MTFTALVVGEDTTLGVDDANVVWSAGAGSGSFEPDTATTNEQGLAQSTWTSGTATGPQTFTLGVQGAPDSVTRMDTTQVFADTVVGSVTIEVDSTNLEDGVTTAVRLTAAADQHGNAIVPLDTLNVDPEPPTFTLASLDPSIASVAPATIIPPEAATIRGENPGTTSIVVTSGAAADTIVITVTPFTGTSAFKGVSAGLGATCGATPGGAAYCWGANYAGQLGTGDSLDTPTPTLVQGLSAVAIDTAVIGDAHGCALGSAAVYCWGDNSVGQLGDGTFSSRQTAVPVTAPAGVTFTAVTLGGSFTCALAATGDAYCWGTNELGQLGDGTTADRNTPVRVAAPDGVTFTSLTAGTVHACALANGGIAYCWGEGAFGQLGNGESNPDGSVPRPTPVLVQSPGLTFARVLPSAAGLHTCAVATSGAAYCWGYNELGQLGDGTQELRTTPVAVSTTESFSGIDGGGLHSCANAVSGTAFCWGENSVGQLGTGDDVSTLTPVPVQSGTLFAAVELGDQHSCAPGQDTQAYCWGDNGFGQLGIGTFGSPSLTPVRVLAPEAPTTAVYAATSRAKQPAPGYEARRRKWCASLQPRLRDRLGACRR